MSASYMIEAVGWLGAICVLAAYMLLSTGRLTAQSGVFHLLNALGAAGFIINTGWHGAIPSMVLNIIWLIVAVVAICRIMLSSR